MYISASLVMKTVSTSRTNRMIETTQDSRRRVLTSLDSPTRVFMGSLQVREALSYGTGKHHGLRQNFRTTTA
jgi:hypothetical protein